MPDNEAQEKSMKETEQDTKSRKSPAMKEEGERIRQRAEQ